MDRRFEWADGARVRVNANVAGEELERISAVHGGIDPAVVVFESQPDDAPLHHAFEWDDDIAAAEYRLSQARALIRCVRIVRDDSLPERAFVHVESVRSYQPVSVAVSNADWWEEVLDETRSKIQSYRQRLAELQRMVDDGRSNRLRDVDKHLEAAVAAME